MEKGTRVKVFRDRTYTIVTNKDGKIKCENYNTYTLTNTVDFIKLLDSIEDDGNTICLAACYSDYGGSYNVQVDIKAQRDEIFDWACTKYKTFSSKFAEL